MAFSSVLDLLFPLSCPGCGICTRAAEPLCRRCLQAVPLHDSLFCGGCRAPLLINIAPCHSYPYILGCATEYRWSSVASLVKNLKFSFQKQAAAALAQLLISYAKNIPMDFLDEPLVVPIPLSRRRLQGRDFNQAEEIASRFAGNFRLPMLERALRRTRDTMPQSTLRRSLRLQNVRGCFAVADSETLRGRDVILIDDVVTSGATLFEAATTLRQSGARRILALTVAKA